MGFFEQDLLGVRPDAEHFHLQLVIGRHVLDRDVRHQIVSDRDGLLRVGV